MARMKISEVLDELRAVTNNEADYDDDGWAKVWLIREFLLRGGSWLTAYATHKKGAEDKVDLLLQSNDYLMTMAAKRHLKASDRHFSNVGLELFRRGWRVINVDRFCRLHEHSEYGFVEAWFVNEERGSRHLILEDEITVTEAIRYKLEDKGPLNVCRFDHYKKHSAKLNGYKDRKKFQAPTFGTHLLDRSEHKIRKHLQSTRSHSPFYTRFEGLREPAYIDRKGILQKFSVDDVKRSISAHAFDFQMISTFFKKTAYLATSNSFADNS